jgi:hypothetical protein
MGLFGMMGRDAIRTMQRNQRARAKAKVPLTATQQLALIKKQEREARAREELEARGYYPVPGRQAWQRGAAPARQLPELSDDDRRLLEALKQRQKAERDAKVESDLARLKAEREDG